MRYGILTTALRWLVVVLILRVLATILLNYPDYFPPNFDSLFLQGREATLTAKVLNQIDLAFSARPQRLENPILVVQSE